MKISAVIATAFREETLGKTLQALDRQTCRPDRVVLVDAAPAPGVEPAVRRWRNEVHFPIDYHRSTIASAAVQRNLGVEQSDAELLLFMDDDLYPEPDCLEKMFSVIQHDSKQEIGGVGILLRNQLARPPSRRAKRWFDFLADQVLVSYGGRVIGPAVNFYHEPTCDGRVVETEWLNAGCVMYRREAFLPEKFGSFFTGYSFMEDVDLSVRIARRWKLKVHTGAYAFHDSQPSCFKRPYIIAKMSVVNRYHVMTETLGRCSPRHHLKFLALAGFSVLAPLRQAHSVRDLDDWVRSMGGIAAGLLSISPSAIARLVRPSRPTEARSNQPDESV